MGLPPTAPYWAPGGPRRQGVPRAGLAGWLAGVRLGWPGLGLRLDLVWISAGFLAFWFDLAGSLLWLDLILIWLDFALILI